MESINTIFTFIIVILLTSFLQGQTDYIVSATNSVLVNDFNYEFDIYILSTGTEPLELATFQTSIYFNAAIRDSGSLSAVFIAGTSTLSDSNQYPNPPNLNYINSDGTMRQLRIAPRTPPRSGNGSLISNVQPGTRFGRFRLTNTISFNKTTPVNWHWNFTTGIGQYSAYMNAYIDSINTNISEPAKFLINLDDPLSTTTTFQISVDVSNGWNMVSVPGINPAGQGVNNWWINHVGTVYKFVPSSGYSGITTTTPGEGYWMKNVGAEIYNTGDEWPAEGIQTVPHNPINASAGWNMFGGYEDIIDAAALTTTPPSQIVYPIYKFVGSTGYQSAAQIVPGYGYWVKVSSNCLINISDVFARGNQKVVEFFKDDWGRITITDATGNSYTLYAVKGGSPNGGTSVDLNQYELPPLPPVGIFDIRFSSGRVAEEIDKGFKTINMNGVVYPLKVKAENMNVRLKDVTGKEINTNVKSGEEITISNPNIDKLMVSGNLIPDKYALEQNYPNPFNPSTTIEFSLPENVKNVKLSIYNILGEKVAELVYGSMQAGKYQYQWDAKNSASGMYIYEIRTEKFVSIKKMVLLK